MKKAKDHILLFVVVLAVCLAPFLSGPFFTGATAQAAEGTPGGNVTKPSGDAGRTEASPLIPSFSDRTRIPAAGKQGPPGQASRMAGNRKAGAALYVKYCQSCHGPQGIGKVPNPGSDDGTVPPLKPIDPDLVDKKASVFAGKIDRYIQHGSIPEGSSPALFMPDWGDSRMLSQKQIAAIEAYIMSINGVVRKK